MKRSELIKGCLFGLMITALVLFGSLPASALCVNYYFTEAGTLVIDQGGAFYDSVTGDPVCYNPTPKHTVVRPLSDFLDVQGTFCFPDGSGGCRIFNPGIPNFILWRDTSRNRRTAFDYAGLVPGFGTVVTGSVSETEQKNGNALVRVNLYATNALNWVVIGTNTATDPVIFGNRFDAVQAGAEPALGNSSFRYEFFNFAMGRPLPDIVEQLSFPNNNAIGLRSLTFTSDSFGELHAAFGVPEGSPGEATVTMLDLRQSGVGPNVPVDNIMVNVAE